MGKIGKISPIKREFSSAIHTLEEQLSKFGKTRIPGTGVYKYPYKENDGRYRTGLDPEAGYIGRIEDPDERKQEISRVKDLKKKLETVLGQDLSPRSKFWNHSLSDSPDDLFHVQAVKLTDSDNVFDLSIPFQELTYTWLKVHPTIASSYEAYQRGEYPADTQFYVCDSDVENRATFLKKQKINKAVFSLEQMTPDRRKKVARLMGLPVAEGSPETEVYNLIDNQLKETEFKKGEFRSLSPVEIFMRFATMKEDTLYVRDLVRQAIQHSIYRQKPGGIFEGELKVAKEESELVEYLQDDKNQEDLLALEQKLKQKKLLKA